MSEDEEDSNSKETAMDVVMAPVTKRTFLETARENLHASAVASNSTLRPDEHALVFEFLKNAIQKWGAEASSLYCCGLPGTGKTMTVQGAAEDAKSWAEENEEEVRGLEERMQYSSS